jgi:hypothetical protein
MLNKYKAVYTPGTRDVDKKLTQDDINKIVSWTSKKLSRVFGGCTSYQAIGSYIANDSSLVTESIVICKAYHDQDDNIAWDAARHIAQVLKRALKQESVTVESQDGIDFI